MQTSHRQKNKHRVPGLPMVKPNDGVNSETSF